MDTDIGDKVVGGAEWLVFEKDSYPQVVEHPVSADWWPEGW